MRIEILDLRAIGPFTDKVLDLSPGLNDLHVVYGRNEAGKSSALRALAAALFGIPAQTPDDFVHEYTALRIGTTLCAANGNRLSSVRRKARTKAVWNAEESDALPEDALLPFLCGVDAEEFQRVFGLDHVRLRTGSDRLLEAAEGADESIVGAALGVSDLRGVRTRIEAEAAELFAANATKRPVNQALSEWKTLQAEIRSSSLSANAWNEARRAADRAEKGRAEAVASAKALHAGRAELAFVARNRPRVTRLADLRDKLEALSDVPDLPGDFANRRRAVEDERRASIVLRDRSRAEEKEARERLTGLPSDFALLDIEPEVDRLREASIEAAKGERDRERRRAAAEMAAAERDRIAKSLGLALPISPAVIEDLRLALGGQERCQGLLQERAGLVTSRTEVARRVAKLRREHGACEERLAGAKESTDVGPLERAVTAALKLGDMDAEIDGLRGELADFDRVLTAGLAGLAGFDGDIDELAARPVPGSRALQEFRRRFDELDDEERQARRKATELQADASGLDDKIDRLCTEQAIPAEEDLARARSRRDAQWRLARKAWLENAEVEAAAGEIDPDRPLAESFERSLEVSDEIADRLRGESKRVAELAEYRHRRADVGRQLAAGDEVAREREGRRDRLGADWSGGWEGTGFEVRDVAAMQDALADRHALLERAERRRTSATKLGEGESRVEAARVDLRTALEASGVPVAGAEWGGRLAPILARAEERRRAFAEGAERRRKDEEERDRLLRELAAEEQKGKDLDADLGEWNGAFAVATRGLPLQEEDPPEAATRVLAEIQSVVHHSDELQGLEGRIASIDRDSEDLAERVRDFVSAHAPDSTVEEPPVAIARLGSLVEQRKRERQEYEMAAKRLREIENERKKAEATVEVSERTLADLAGEAGVETAADLPGLVQRADDKRRLYRDHEDLGKDLLNEGCSIVDTEARVAAMVEVEIEAELAPLEGEIEQADREAEACRESATQARLAFDALERDTGSSDLAGKAEGIAAGLTEDVERYARLVLASRLLGAGVERFRERNEAPMLSCASHYLDGLTRGRYTRVETDVDDKNQSHFLVRSTSGAAAKRVEDLSDGTRDQLHLALVLGSLEYRFASGAEPLPLVLDDILVHFDDERTMAALETLAEFSKTMQVLLFTHHERVRDQADGVGNVCEL